MDVEVDLLLGRKLGKAVCNMDHAKGLQPCSGMAPTVTQWEGKLQVHHHKTQINAKGVTLSLGLIALVKGSFRHPPSSESWVRGTKYFKTPDGFTEVPT